MPPVLVLIGTLSVVNIARMPEIFMEGIALPVERSLAQNLGASNKD